MEDPTEPVRPQATQLEGMKALGIVKVTVITYVNIPQHCLGDDHGNTWGVISSFQHAGEQKPAICSYHGFV